MLTQINVATTVMLEVNSNGGTMLKFTDNAQIVLCYYGKWSRDSKSHVDNYFTDILRLSRLIPK